MSYYGNVGWWGVEGAKEVFFKTIGKPIHDHKLSEFRWVAPKAQNTESTDCPTLGERILLSPLFIVIVVVVLVKPLSCSD